MTPPTTRTLEPLTEFQSPEVSIYFAQLEDLTGRLRKDLAEATPEQLEWQLAPGMNTCGMLLAHIAVAEVFWASVIAERAFLCEQVLGIGADDDGLPLAEGGAPPVGLAGKPLGYFTDLILRARENTRALIAPLATADLSRAIEHRRRDGIQTLNGHWILYHMVEHLGGHHAQINLLRHIQKLRAGALSGASASS